MHHIYAAEADEQFLNERQSCSSSSQIDNLVLEARAERHLSESVSEDQVFQEFKVSKQQLVSKISTCTTCI